MWTRRAWCGMPTTAPPLGGRTMVATVQWLGVIPSISRPPISNDTPYSEALVRTLKQTPAYPTRPFADLEAARAWVARFVAWYNGEHRHVAICYVTPEARHFGHEAVILAQRHVVDEAARRRRPDRWTGPTRNWTPVGPVLLTPEPTLPGTVGPCPDQRRQLP